MIDEIIEIANSYIGKIPQDKNMENWTDLMEKQEIEIREVAENYIIQFTKK